MIPFFATIASKLWWVVLLAFLAAGAWAYWSWSRAAIADLKVQVTLIAKQADDLQAANAHMRADIDAINKAQAQATKSMQDIATKTAQAEQAIRNQHLAAIASAHPKVAEKQINDATAQAFQAFEDASNAP